MDIFITPLYAGVLGLWYMWLSLRVIGKRQSSKTSLGDGDNDMLIRRIRTHGNFVEYIPFSLVCLLLLEINGTDVRILHSFGVMLLLGRLLHFHGLYSKDTPGWARVWGMQLTLWPLMVMSLLLIAGFFW